jgi:hypothetical protein
MVRGGDHAKPRQCSDRAGSPTRMGFSAPRLNLMLLMTVEPEHDWKRRPAALAVFAYALLYLIPTQRRNFWIVRWLSKSPPPATLPG